jgi:PAS domain S-box-containing protein
MYEPGTFWLQTSPDADFAPWPASRVLLAIEEGEIGLDCMLKVNPEATPSPLRRWIRQLVYTTWTVSPGGQIRSAPRSTLEAAFAEAPVAMAVADLSGRLLSVNPAFCTLLGWSEGELLGAAVGNLSDPTDREAELRLGREMLAGERVGFQVQKWFRHRDGERIPTLLSIALIRDDGGRPQELVSSLVDLRVRQALEEQQRRAGELVATRQFASGVAHDLKNVLSVVQLTSGVLRESGHAAGEDLDALDAASRVGVNLARQLQVLARTRREDAPLLEVGNELHRLFPMLRRLLPAGVDLQTQAEAGCVAPVEAEDLEQILLNLVLNAGQHSPVPGRVTVHVGSGEPGWVELRVADAGPGMTDEVLNRAREPFFSGRPGGTGLGLAVVDAAVRRSNGELLLARGKERGTVVRVRFPEPPPGVSASLPRAR